MAGKETLNRLNEAQRDFIAADVNLTRARIRLRHARRPTTSVDVNKMTTRILTFLGPSMSEYLFHSMVVFYLPFELTFNMNYRY